MKFNDLNLSDPILRSLKDQNYKEPTPIQAEVIPAILNKSDIMAAAQTGTDKTAAFVLPILSILSNPKNNYKGHQLRALIVTPTRELAAQVRESVNTYSKYLSIRSTAVYGGARIHNQKLKLRKGIDVLVATPGRLLDLYNQKSVNFKNIEILVLDEADQMLDMGFIHDIKKIASLLPERRQNLMFTATFSNSFRALAKEMADKAIEVSVTNDNEAGENIEHYVHPVDKSRKAELLIELIETQKWDQALVFTRTKHGADRLQKQLDKVDIKSKAIHGNKTQNNRMKALDAFKNNKIKILVATDVAARGIDISDVTHVINYRVPENEEDYVHRIGRTGRAEKEGDAFTLLTADELEFADSVEGFINKKIERKKLEGFEYQYTALLDTEKRKPIKKPRRGGGKRRRR